MDDKFQWGRWPFSDDHVNELLRFLLLTVPSNILILMILYDIILVYFFWIWGGARCQHVDGNSLFSIFVASEEPIVILLTPKLLKRDSSRGHKSHASLALARWEERAVFLALERCFLHAFQRDQHLFPAQDTKSVSSMLLGPTCPPESPAQWRLKWNKIANARKRNWYLAHSAHLRAIPAAQGECCTKLLYNSQYYILIKSPMIPPYLHKTWGEGFCLMLRKRWFLLPL